MIGKKIFQNLLSRLIGSDLLNVFSDAGIQLLEFGKEGKCMLIDRLDNLRIRPRKKFLIGEQGINRGDLALLFHFFSIGNAVHRL